MKSIKYKIIKLVNCRGLYLVRKDFLFIIISHGNIPWLGYGMLHYGIIASASSIGLGWDWTRVNWWNSLFHILFVIDFGENEGFREKSPNLWEKSEFEWLWMV